MFKLINIARAAAVAGLVSGCVALTAPAFAADEDALPHGTLVVRGVDFTSPRTVAHLKHQLHRVAMAACMANSGGRVFMSRDEQACYDTAFNDGLTQIAGRQQQALQEAGHSRTVRLADSKADGTSAN